jgi:hypothetical protein
MKIYGIKMIDNEKDLDVITNFLETLARFDWPYPWGVTIKSQKDKSWIQIVEPDDDDWF